MRRVSRALALALIGATTAQAAPPGDEPKADLPAPAVATLTGETDENRWPMSLPEAIRIALDNSDSVCVLYAQLPPGTITDRDRQHPGPFVDYEPYYEAPSCWGPSIKKAPIAGPVMISPVKADMPLPRFRAEIGPFMGLASGVR